MSKYFASIAQQQSIERDAYLLRISTTTTISWLSSRGGGGGLESMAAATLGSGGGLDLYVQVANISLPVAASRIRLTADAGLDPGITFDVYQILTPFSLIARPDFTAVFAAGNALATGAYRSGGEIWFNYGSPGLERGETIGTLLLRTNGNPATFRGGAFVLFSDTGQVGPSGPIYVPFGPPISAAVVPEPGSVALFAAGSLAFIARRSRRERC